MPANRMLWIFIGYIVLTAFSLLGYIWGKQAGLIWLRRLCATLLCIMALCVVIGFVLAGLVLFSAD